MDLKSKLKQFINENQLLNPGQLVIVGYSGGVDSTCLLSLLKELDFDVVAAHLNHQQRDNSEREQLLCQAFAEDLGVPFIAGKADVPLMASQMKIGIEEAGRKARYEFFRQCSLRLSHAPVATAHNKNDLVETIFLNLARGTGLSGLSGIPVSRDGIVRPLLFASRVEIQSYVEENGFWHCEDATNHDEQFSRVRARKNLVPNFETLHESAIENAYRTSRIIREEDSLLDSLATALIQSSEINNKHQLSFVTRFFEIELDSNKIRHAPSALLRRSLRLCAEAFGGVLDWKQTEVLSAAIIDRKKCSITIEDTSVVIEVSESKVRCSLVRPVSGYRQLLTIPGDTISDELGWMITCFETDKLPEKSENCLSVLVNADAIKGNLYIKNFEPGDRMVPFGGQTERKLQDLMTNAKLGKQLKERLPIVCDMLGPIWIPGVKLSERMRVCATTKRRMSLNFGPVLNDPSV